VGHATISGANSQWINSDSLSVGGDGFGTMTIQNGGSVSSGSGGIATVNGAGSTWICGGLQVGLGTLTIAAGGSVSSDTGVIGGFTGGAGTVTVTGAGSTWTNTGDLRVGVNGGGTLYVFDEGLVSVGGTLSIGAGSTASGDGTIDGNVTNNGLVAPGASPGALNIEGDYAQSAAGTLHIELAGVVPGTQYDQLLITGDAMLDGTLEVSLLGGFVPSPGQSYTLLTAADVDGTFSIEMLPSVPGRIFDVIYNPQSVVLTVLPAFTADFDEDGDVDSPDFAQWRGDFGENALSDADNDGDSDGADFLAWQRQLGSLQPATPAADAVPEPGLLALISLVSCGSALFRQRRR